MQGLLGNNDGDSTNDFALRDGTQRPNNLTAKQIHEEYGESWRVQRQESLFDKPASKVGLPQKFVSLDNFPKNQVNEAQDKVFEAGITNENRINAVALDLLVTKDESFLTAAVQFFKSLDNSNTVIESKGTATLAKDEDGIYLIIRHLQKFSSTYCNYLLGSDR